MVSENDVRILAIAIALAGLKEYKADWLKNANTVVRDASGRFASKASDAKQAIAEKSSATATSVKELASLVKEGGEIGADVVNNLVKDKEFRKRAGLESGMAMAKVIDKLTDNPKVEAKIQAFSEDAAEQLRDAYGEDNAALKQALRKTKGQLPEGKNFKERLEKGIVLSKAYSDALKDPEEYSRREEIASKAAAAVVPVAVSLAIAVGPEIAIPLAMTGSIELGEALASAVLGEILSRSANKALDAAKIDNPAVRIGASLLTGAAAGGVVGVAKTVDAANDGVRAAMRSVEDEIDSVVSEAGRSSRKYLDDVDFSNLSRADVEYVLKPDTQAGIEKITQDLSNKKISPGRARKQLEELREKTMKRRERLQKISTNDIKNTGQSLVDFHSEAAGAELARNLDTGAFKHSAVDKLKQVEESIPALRVARDAIANAPGWLRKSLGVVDPRSEEYTEAYLKAFEGQIQKIEKKLQDLLEDGRFEAGMRSMMEKTIERKTEEINKIYSEGMDEVLELIDSALKSLPGEAK